MKTIKNSITMLAFALAGFAAFAFNAPHSNAPTIKHALNPDTEEWEPIPGAIEGQDYQCNQQVETACTIEFTQSGQMLPETRKEGEFVAL